MSAVHTAFQRAKELGAIPTDWSSSMKQSITAMYNSCPKGFEVDHIRPLAEGGLHHPANLQCLTQHANRIKGAFWAPSLIQSTNNWWITLPFTWKIVLIAIAIAILLYIIYILYDNREVIGNRITSIGNSVKEWFVNEKPDAKIKELTVPQLMTVAVFG